MDVGAVLLDILVVLVAAKIAAEVAERFGFPGVVAEIVAGVIVGPSLLGFVGNDETLRVLGELGVILLLLQVGMEMDLGELRAVGRASLSVAVVGVVVPMATGFAAMSALGESTNTALFLGAALAATSVGITARVFSDLRALASVEARTVLGAAVADDVLGLVILTVVVRIVSEGTVSVLDVAGIVGVAVAFLVITAAAGTRVAPKLFRVLHERARSEGTLVALALAFTLGFAELADAAKLAPIVGAFVAGLSLSRSSAKERMQRELAPIGHLLIPVFFLQIGIDANVDEFFSLSVLGIAGVLLVVAIVAKLVAALGATGAPGDKWLIGFGMLPRGEVGLIFATIGLHEGVLGRELYAALLLVVLVTTVAAPPLLKWRLGAIRRRAPAFGPVDAKPVDGWLRRADGEVELAANPPTHLALHIGLQAAQEIAAGARPGAQLLDWLGALGDTNLRWDDDATRELFEVLRLGNPRTWRFLEVTGLLERALPELAATVARRRADPFLLEPAHVLTFSLVEALREVAGRDARARAVRAELEHPERLMLAALILDAAGEDDAPVDLARRLVARLDLGAAAEEEVALLVGSSDLLLAAAGRVDGLGEERVLQIASHLDRPETARALYLLTLALGGLEPWDRQRLDQLLDLVLAVLRQPGVTDLDARNLVQRRRAEAVRIVGGDPHVAERIEAAPRAYLMSQDSADVARHATLLDPVPRRGLARVVVDDVGAHEWRIEVVLRDRPGLLATVSGVLASNGLDVLDAVVATWPDGAALESFRVRRALLEPAQLEAERVAQATPPSPDRLGEAIAEALEQPLEAPPNPDAIVTFDDASSPWYTLCEVRSPDRRGLLHTIAVAIAAAGADVHSARLVTVDGLAVDQFELTDRNQRKLDGALETTIVDAIAEGVKPPRVRRRLARR